MPQFFFRCYVWDLEEEGIEAALDHVAGLGVDALSVAVTSRRIREPRPRSASQDRVCVMEGGAHFVPTRKHYPDLRIRPTSSSWMKARNPLEKIARQAERVGVRLRASVSCCRSEVLAAKHSDAACVNVFGTLSVEHLCPANPDVREYAAAVIEDLSTNYPFETLEVSHADFGDGEDFQQYLTRGVTPSEGDRALWSWCFCAACRQRATDAGVDVEAASAKVREHLERMFLLEPPTHPEFESLIAAEASLAAYQRVRIDAVTSLVKSIRSRTKRRLILDSGSPPRISGAEMGQLNDHTNGFWLALPGRDGPAIVTGRDRAANPRLSFDETVQAAGGAGRVDLLISCCPPETGDGPSLVAAVHRAAQAGYASIGFDNYGLAAAPCLDWVRQAIRFAKRQDAV